ncbi:MAG: sugar ABC transporter permease [Anaerolineae bacterium]|nr:sugar ABC transporter permease [Anaerolineae bacterium]
MATVVTTRKQGQGLPKIIYISAAWNIIIMLGSFALSYILFTQEPNKQLKDLGDNVRYFLALIALIPAAAAMYSVYGLLARRPGGRYASMALNYVGAVLSFLYLLHLWGVFIAFDDAGKALFENSFLLWGFVIAYAVYWLAGRLPEYSPSRRYLEMFAIGVAMLALIALLLLGGAVEGVWNVISTYGELQTWAVTIVVIIFAFVGYQILNQGDFFGETPDQRTSWQGWLMVSPNIIGFMLFFAGPLLLSFYLSFTDSEPGSIPDVIGFKNYGDILSLEFKTLDDPEANPQRALSFGYIPLDDFKIGNTRVVIGAKDVLFWKSLRNTVVFCMMLVPLSSIPALLLAVIMNSKIPGMKFFRAAYFLPSVAAVVGTALIWRWLYASDIGYINYAITEFVNGINSIFGTHIEYQKTQWLTDQGILLFSIVLLAAWQAVGFNTVLFLAGLQGIPTTLYEASFVDGANRVQQFRHVTLPLLAPTTFYVIVTTVITGLQVFNEPYALISSRPIPDAATTSVIYLYNRGFFRFEFGYASAVAWLLFALIFVVTIAQFRLQRSGSYDV